MLRLDWACVRRRRKARQVQLLPATISRGVLRFSPRLAGGPKRRKLLRLAPLRWRGGFSLRVNHMVTLSSQTIAKMRQIEQRISQLLDEIIKIRTPTRSLVGGADFELELEAHVSAAFVMALNKGATPESAANSSKSIGEQFVKEWNRNYARQRVTITSKHEVQRWAKAGDKHAERLQREFEQISLASV